MEYVLTEVLTIFDVEFSKFTQQGLWETQITFDNGHEYGHINPKPYTRL